jgi:hypothetical protein
MSLRAKSMNQKKFVAWWERVPKIMALKVRVLESRGLKL